MWFWYRENEQGEVSLLKIFGNLPVVTVPESIMGHPIVELAPYCFSEKNIYTGKEDGVKIADAENLTFEDESDTLEKELESGMIRELSGEYITEVTLPDSLKKIGDLCFYQCRNLESISIGGPELTIGSDAFMNCRRLHTFTLRTEAKNRTGLRQILLQRNEATDVYFEDAAVHFPEFSEHYDLIGPAHIFELNIEGEGFRARQCFESGVFQFENYDRNFVQACDREPACTLCRMAALRLKFPLNLRAEDRERYEIYLLSHVEEFCEECIRQKDLSLLEALSSQGLFEEKHFNICMEKMLQAKWIQGTRMILLIKKRLADEVRDC